MIPIEAGVHFLIVIIDIDVGCKEFIIDLPVIRIGLIYLFDFKMLRDIFKFHQTQSN